MKKWEEQQKNKVYQSKIKNVKASISNTGVRKSVKLNKSLNDSKQLSSIKSPALNSTNENPNSISDYYESEKNNLQSIPLYRILKIQNLQQYAKELISRGYGYDLKKFNYLNQQQLNDLMDDIRVLPGHKTKLLDLIDLVSNEMIPEIENNSMWNLQSTEDAPIHHYNAPQLSGRPINKANSAKALTGKQQYQIPGTRQPQTTKNSSNINRQQNNTTYNLQRKHSQPQVSNNQNRNNHHMYYQGNQKQLKSHTSHIKKRSGIGYDYFIDSQDENDGYDEFQEAIQNLVHQYNFTNNLQIFKDKQQPQNTDESFKNELNDLDLEFELEQNIGYKNHTQMRAKLEKAVNQVNKQPIKTQNNNSSGNSIGSQSSSLTQASKNTTLNNTKSSAPSQTISNTSLNSQKQSQNLSSQASQKQQYQSSQITTAKPSSSQSQKRPSSGVQKPAVSQVSAQQQTNKDSIQSKGITSGQQIKEQQKVVKKEQIQQIYKELDEDKARDPKKGKVLDSKQKLDIEKLKQKSSEQTRTYSHSQTQKDLASQTQQGGQIQQNSSGQNKKARPQTAKYMRNSYVQDDQCLIPEYDENDNIILNYKENRLIKNLRKNIASKNDQNQDELNPQLDYDSIKHMYMSYDGGKLTSTIVNLDIEEMCFCFACAMIKHVERGEEIEKGVQNQKMHNNLHKIEEEHEDNTGKENSSKQLNKKDYYYYKGMVDQDSSGPSYNPQTYVNPNQNQYNDTSLNKTTNPIEEPTMIQDDYNQSIINADAERYLKDDDIEYRSGDQKFPPQEFKVNVGDFNWKQKKSLSDISERTHEISHQNNKSQSVDQFNEQSYHLKNNLTTLNSRKQFEQSRQEIEEILKESLLLNVRDNQSLRRRLEVDNHDDEKEFEYTENEDEEDESHQNVSIKKKGYQSYQNEIGNSKIPFEESSMNQFQYDNLEKNPNSDDEDNEFLSKNISAKDKRGNQICVQSESNYQDESQQEQEAYNQSYNEEQCEEVESEGEIEIDQNINEEEEEDIRNDYQEGVEGESQLTFSTISRYSMVIPNDENSNKRLFDKTYNYKENTDQIFTQKPTQETIQNYCKNICISCQLEKQIPIIALVYIERLLNNSGFSITPKNWRKITITSMIMASKIWDDESFENKNFSQAFPQFDVVQINEMERVFLNFIDYNLYVKGADYAKYYFILREFAQKNKKSFPLRPLDLKTILHLQNNANRAQSHLKEMYQNPLNKSF